MKLFLCNTLLLLTCVSITQAQVQTFTSQVKFKNVPLGSKKDSALVLGTDGSVRHLPLSGFAQTSGIQNQTAVLQPASFKISGSGTFTNPVSDITLTADPSGISHRTPGSTGIFNLSGVSFSGNEKSSDFSADKLRFTAGSKTINLKPAFNINPGTQNYDVYYPKNSGNIAIDEETLHKTGNESRTSGKLTLSTPSIPAGPTPVNAVAPLAITIGKASDNNATTGDAIAGNGPVLFFTGGNGGDVTSTNGRAFSGAGSSWLFYGGDGGNIYSPSSEQIAGNGGDFIALGGATYGGKPGAIVLTGGANAKAGKIGGDVFIAGGYGNNSSLPDLLYEGAVYLAVNASKTPRGNVVVGGKNDDKLNKLQVTGNTVIHGNITAMNGVFQKLYVSETTTPPSSATDAGETGEIRITPNYIYVCSAPNTWVRTVLSSW